MLGNSTSVIHSTVAETCVSYNLMLTPFLSMSRGPVRHGVTQDNSTKPYRGQSIRVILTIGGNHAIGQWDLWPSCVSVSI